MKNKKLILGFILFILGAIGILSILTMEIPLPPEAEAMLKSRFSPKQIKLLTLINPTFILILAIITGTLLYDKVNLKVLIAESLLRKNTYGNSLNALKYGIMGGIISGILLTLIGVLFYPYLPETFVELGEKIKPSLAARFLYGGITEEILMRFGLMTFIVWLFFKIFKELKPIVYWIGILIAAILFAAGHFPIAFQAVEKPSALLVAYLLIANSTGGIIFGWLYWKKGLESAFLAHIFTHVVIVLAAPFLNQNI